MTARIIAVTLVVIGSPAFAHRLDEYLQGTILSVEKDRIQVQMTLTPGVAVFPFLISTIDTDSNGMISDVEETAHAKTVLKDISLTLNGRRLTPRLLSTRFPALSDLKEGRGQIQLDFTADLPAGHAKRKLLFENRHQSPIAAYQVNCLVPNDTHIQITSQVRDYLQSRYELDYVQTGIPLSSGWITFWPGWGGALSLIALLGIVRVVQFFTHANRNVAHPLDL